MKKLICITLAITCLMSLAACGTKEEQKTETAVPVSDVQEEQNTDTKVESTENREEVSLSELKQGDEVSIVGQTAASSLENGDTLWVQVLRQGERTIVYHCQMKDEYIEQAEKLNILDVTKVKGNFLNLIDMANEPDVSLSPENIAIIVTLYDCELTD